MIKISWSELKTLADQGKVSITFIEKTSEYVLYIKINGILFSSVLFKDGGADVSAFEASYKALGNKGNGDMISPFAQKTFNGKGLFKRIHGLQMTSVIGMNTFEFVVPYNQCKITGVEIIGASSCDIADLEVYDTATGTFSGVPNYMLNQFGFTVNVSKDFYEQKSEFDSDLYLGMKIEVHLVAQAAGLIGINLILNEVK